MSIMDRRVVAICILAWGLTGLPLAAAEPPVSVTVTVGGIKPWQSRSTVEGRVGPPILEDPCNRICHYLKGLIVIYDPAARVINVHGPEMEVDGKSLGITSRAEIEKLLGPGHPEAGEKDSNRVVFPKYGLTVYQHQEPKHEASITGFLLEPSLVRPDR